MTPTENGQKTMINLTGIFICAAILSGWIALNAAPAALATYLSLPSLHPVVADLAQTPLLASTATTIILALLAALNYRLAAGQASPHP